MTFLPDSTDNVGPGQERDRRGSSALAKACGFFALLSFVPILGIAGGVVARTPEILIHEDFRKEFLDSPTMGHLLATIPVFLMDNQDSGLWGAAFHGRQIIGKG